MKVLQLGKFYPIQGGVEKVMYELLQGVSGQGIECDMLCAALDGGHSVLDINENAKLICCHSLAKLAATMISPDMVVTLKKVCWQYDIIHVHHPDPIACLALWMSGFKGKVVLHWHSDILKQKQLLKFYKPLQQWLIKRADTIVGTTPVYIRESPYLYKFRNKTCCLPMGIDKMPNMPEKAHAVKDRFQGRKIVFSLGRMVGYKGFTYLVEAAKYLNDDYVVLIGGTGPLEEDLKLQCSYHGLTDKVKFLGFVSDEDLPAYYEACDVFCLSSVLKTEAFGIVQIEAMSCAKPVVATRIPHSGVAWVNMDGVSGINVPPRDPKAIAEAVMQITKDNETYRRFSLGALKRYNENFTKEHMIENCINIYKNLYDNN